MLPRPRFSVPVARRFPPTGALRKRAIAATLAEALEPRTLLSAAALPGPALFPADDSPPAITTADSDTLYAGVGGSFTVIATGSPTPAWSESTQLPMGVSFTDNGDGTATFTIPPTVSATTAGITITASNANTPNATQDFTLTIVQPNDLTVSNLNDSGAGSLRAAITQANLGGGVNLISFAQGLKGTISLKSPLPDLDANILIEGAGLTISGAHSTGSVLTTDAGFFFEFHNLAITGGRGTDGGGIDNAGTLAISNCTVTGNSAAEGGGVFNDTSGVLTISNSAIEHNSVNVGGGGVFSDGGIVFASDSTFAYNAAGGGFDSNGGGGIAIQGAAGTLTCTNCTIAFNTAVFDGGISDQGSALTLTDCTIDQNKTISDGGGVDVSIAGTTVVINGTIIARNSSPDLLSFSPTVITGSNDLIGDGSDIVTADNPDCTLENTLRGTQTHELDPKLGPLANNGGPTPTQAELSGAPGIAHGADFPVLDSTNADITATDQRGALRPRKYGGIDIGAFQLPPTYLAKRIVILPIAKTMIAGNDIANSATTSSFTVELVNAAGQVDTTNNSIVGIMIAKGPTNALISDSVQAVAGIATFSDVPAYQAGTYILEATAADLPSAKSNTFTVAPDAPTAHLAVYQRPFENTVGKPLFPKLIVRVEDTFGNIITAGHSKVTVSILTNPTNGVLTGTTTITTTKGVANFSNLKLSQAGAGYVLKLTDNSLPAGNTTASFTQDISMVQTSVATPHTASSYTLGKTITLTTTFKSSAPLSIPFTGEATVEAQGGPLGEAQLNANGSIKFLLTGVSAGTYTCTIQYAGDNNHDPVNSNTFTLKVV